jgi:uncharacterized membrane protein YhaH (DUF805 family)
MDLLFGFSGRIGRAKWWLAEFSVLVVWAVIIAAFAGIVELVDPSAEYGPGELSNGGLSLGIAIATGTLMSVWINVAATVKRFHDRDKSGFWFFIVFVPFIGPVWQIVECGLLPGDPSANRFGPPSGGGRSGYADDVEAHVASLKAERVPRQSARVAPALAPAAAGRRQPTAGGGFGRRGR